MKNVALNALYSPTDLWRSMRKAPRRVALGAFVTIAALPSAAVVLEDTVNDEQARHAETKWQEGPPLILCDPGMEVDYGLLFMDPAWINYDEIERTALAGFTETGDTVKRIMSAEDDAAAYNEAAYFLGSKGVNLTLDVPEKYHSSNSYVRAAPNKQKLAYLVSVLASIPRSLIDKADLKGISLVKNLKRNDKESLEITSDSSRLSLNGRYYFGDNWTIIDEDILDEYKQTVETVYHEVIAHGVLPQLCDPDRDYELWEINESVVPGLVYVPYLMQTPDQAAFFSSGVITNQPNGGSNQDEDTAEGFESIFDELEEPKENDGRVIDRKQELVIGRLKKEVPNIEEWIAYMRYKIGVITLMEKAVKQSRGLINLDFL